MLPLFSFNFSICIQTKGRQLSMSLQAARQHRVWCSLADPKICTLPTHHQLKKPLITSLPHVTSCFHEAKWVPETHQKILETHAFHSLMSIASFTTTRLTKLRSSHEHPVLGFQMAGTCYAEHSLPEMAGHASQMPKQNDGSLHSSSRLVRKDTCSVEYWETSALLLEDFSNLGVVSKFQTSRKKALNTTYSISCEISPTRWWQLKYFLFSPRKLGKWSHLTDAHIFFIHGLVETQRNHQIFPTPKVFSIKKNWTEVLVLLLPVAIVSPYAAWNAWHPKFEPPASPPLEFKSIEVRVFSIRRLVGMSSAKSLWRFLCFFFEVFSVAVLFFFFFRT